MLLWLQVLEIRMQILKLNKQGDVQEKQTLACLSLINQLSIKERFITAYIKVSDHILIITSCALSNWGSIAMETKIMCHLKGVNSEFAHKETCWGFASKWWHHTWLKLLQYILFSLSQDSSVSLSAICPMQIHELFILRLLQLN